MKKIYHPFLLFLVFLNLNVRTIIAQELWGVTSLGGGYGSLFGMTTGGSTINTQSNLKSVIGSSPQYPKMVEVGGKLYGMTSAGGTNGVLFEYDPLTNVYVKKVGFTGTSGSFMGGNPQGSLIYSGGKLYGLTRQGGTSNLGTIFEYNITTNTYSVLVSLTGTTGAAMGSGPFGSLYPAANGKFYGVTRSGGSSNVGVIFEFVPGVNTYNVLNSFTGNSGAVLGGSPNGALTEGIASNKLYGLTSAGGTNSVGVLFEYDYNTSTYTSLTSFTTSNGSVPFNTLTKAVNGKLYGTTNSGGSSSLGTIFEFDIASSTYTKKVDFTGTTGANPGSNPQGGLTEVSGKLYGVTRVGGANNVGTVFEYDYGTNTFTKKADLVSGTGGTGTFPQSTFVQSSVTGKLYAVTSQGGANSGGVIFEYDPATSTYTKKLDFNFTNGYKPTGTMALAGNNKFYGLASMGGASDLGVVFEYDQSTNTYTKKIDLASANGSLPYGSMVEAGGKLYGMTSSGGVSSSGVIFEYNYSSNTYTKKIDFTGTAGIAPGSFPYGAMVSANGKLYGLTSSGGANNLGVIFEYDYGTNIYVKKVDFTGTGGGAIGASPLGSLILASNGKLYGLTKTGGAGNLGVLFEYDYSTNTCTKKIDFDGASLGSLPNGSLVESAGKLYGMTQAGGSNNLGVIFEYDLIAGTCTKKMDMSSGTGSSPQGSMIRAANGNLYGMTSSGGTNNLGGVFEYAISSNTYTKKLDFTLANGSTPVYSAFWEICVLPSAAGAVSAASLSMCAGSAAPLTFSISTISNATGYNWTLPSGASVSSGSNTNNVSVDMSAVAAGTYTIRGNGTNVCGSGVSSSVIFTVNAIPAITVNSGAICSGGSFTLNPGGANTYTFFPTGPVVSPVSLSSYTVSGTSVAGCQSSVSAVSSVTVHTLPVVSALTSHTAICTGGTVTLNGNGADTYTWTASSGSVADGIPFTPTSTASYSVAGTNTLTGCTSTNSAIQSVTVNPLPVISSTAVANVLCNGGTGSATLTASGGTPGYSYLWSTGATTSVVTGTSGVYTATVTDANSCVATKSVTISQPSALVTSTAVTNSLCNGGTGSATVTASGGTGAYTYSWSTTATTSVITSVSGVRTVTVTDANNCTSTKSVTISQPSALVTSTAVTNPLCNGGTGSATVAASGGTGAYTYSWSTTATTSVITSGSGVRTVTVTDANNCTSTKSVTISQPSALVTSTAVTNPLCNGGTGSATVTAYGGTGAYTYSWSTASTASVVTGISGVAIITVTDANNCTGTKSVTIIQPPALLTTTAVTNPVCNGGTGSATVTASGGTGAYTYLWSTASTASVVTGLSGVNTATVSDANNCTSIKSVSISQPALITSSITAQANVNCHGSLTGSVVINAGGGTGSLSYTWSPGGGNSFTASGLSAGNYSVTIQDANLCTTIQTVTITEPASALSATSSQSNVSCFGGSNGTISLNVTGGTGAYTYSWTTGGNSNIEVGLPMGVYSTTITDANSCITTVSVSVTEPTLLTANTSASAVLCNGGTATVTLSATGGTPSYTGVGTYTAMAGTETYTVMDANNCIATASLSITEPTVLTANAAVSAVLCNGGTATVTVSATGGTASYTGVGTYTVMAGTETYTVMDANNCVTTASVSITEPAVLTANASASSVLCNGGTATVTVSAAGGTAIYTGVGTYTAIAGTETYTVTDSNNCMATASVSITEPTALILAASADLTVICNGASVSLTANASGGTSPYTYELDAVSSSSVEVVTPAANTTYTIDVTDANNCSQTAAVSVTVNALPTLSVTTSHALICAGETATLTAAGADSYTWSTAETATVIAVSPGSTDDYTVTGTDGNTGCSNSVVFTQSVSLCTGISIIEQETLNVYPNPSKSEFNIDLPASSKVMVYDILGHVIYTEQLQEGKNTIDLKQHADGVYLMKVEGLHKAYSIRLIKG